MAEFDPSECDCMDADLDILTGIETCYSCGTRRYLTSAEMERREELQAEYDTAMYNLEMEQQDAERAAVENPQKEPSDS